MGLKINWEGEAEGFLSWPKCDFKNHILEFLNELLGEHGQKLFITHSRSSDRIYDVKVYRFGQETLFFKNVT